MANGFSKGELLEFLDYLANKGLAGPSMIAGRKTAANALLGVLSDDEVSDVRELDLDEVAQRLLNLRGTEFKPESVRVYKSRVGSAIEDFVRYRRDPIAFKPVGAKKVSARVDKSARSEPPVSGATSPPLSPASHLDPTKVSEITFPVPIRPGVVVRLIGVPNDLSRKEAEKIGAVALALATNEGE
jgi:hypothetical protein